MIRYFSTATAAEMVGMSKRWINYQIEAGRLRACNVGAGGKKQYRISEADLQLFMESHPEVEKRAKVVEIAAEAATA